MDFALKSKLNTLAPASTARPESSPQRKCEAVTTTLPNHSSISLANASQKVTITTALPAPTFPKNLEAQAKLLALQKCFDDEENVESQPLNLPMEATTATSALPTAASEDEPLPKSIESHEERQFFGDICVEVGRRLWSSSPLIQHYLKGCQWSPDGTCVLAPVHMDGIHLIELPSDLFSSKNVSKERPLTELNTSVFVREGGTVYDFAWYPFMNSNNPDTCCWLSSRQHEPIHMWDAYDGTLRCSYRGYDDVHEIEAAISIVFSPNGSHVLGGYKKNIKVFDTNVPGRDFCSFSVKQAVSCFAFGPQSEDNISCGSWNGSIYHHDLRTPNAGPMLVLKGHCGGVTWLKYSQIRPAECGSIFSGARKDDSIIQWDLRNGSQPVRTFRRAVATNQRIYFDLSPKEEWLASGDTDGYLRFWDLTTNDLIAKSLSLHADCCNGVSFNPAYPVLATTSGQFHFLNQLQGEHQQSIECPSSALPNENVLFYTQKDASSDHIIPYENALLLLWCGKSNFDTE